MAVTKILARKARLDVLVHYALNGEKTEERILTAYQNCTPRDPYQQMLKTKQAYEKTDGVQGYHIIQSFAKGEVTPELALETAREYAAQCIPDYQAVIGVHVDKSHIHAHIVFNSVNFYTGEKYLSNAESYYGQIRAISDRLCKEHGLSVILQGEGKQVRSYAEWLRERSGEPTFRAMLLADLRQAIEDANDYGHFLLLMEHIGYEIKHGNRLSFRLRGQERWMVPGRKEPLFTEDGIRAAIQGNLEAIEAGEKPLFVPRRAYMPYRKHPKYTGFLALYVHYLYLLGKIEKRQYPPKMTPHLKTELMKFERYKEQFAFLREHGITSPEQLAAHQQSCETRLAALTKQRTILNARKKRRKPLYDALAASDALRPALELYQQGVVGMEAEAVQYRAAEAFLEKAGVPRERLLREKAEAYRAIAEVNREIRAVRKELALCGEIEASAPTMEREIRSVEKSQPEKDRAREHSRNQPIK